jgi:hypothetical protein
MAINPKADLKPEGKAKADTLQYINEKLSIAH